MNPYKVHKILAASIFVASILIYRSLGVKKKKVVEITCNVCNGNPIMTDMWINYNGYNCNISCNFCDHGITLVRK